MITGEDNNSWPMDLPLHDPAEAGVSKPSIIRLKIHSIDKDLIRAKIGRLSQRDIQALKTNLKSYFEL